MNKHLMNGNCWITAYDCTSCGFGTLCDVCHDHDEVRGECDECRACQACADDGADRDHERSLSASVLG